MRSLECYFGVYFPCCCATREINTKITLSWVHKQFATRVHTLFSIYPVHGTNLTVIQPMWSAYPYAMFVFFKLYGIHMPLFSLYGIHMPLFSLYGSHMPLFSLYGSHMPLCPYMVIQPIVLGMALLWALHSPRDCHCDVTMIWPLLFHGIRGRERDTRQHLDNTNARRLQTVNR